MSDLFASVCVSDTGDRNIRPNAKCFAFDYFQAPKLVSQALFTPCHTVFKSDF